MNGFSNGSVMSKNALRLAIVATIADAEDSIDQFILYHIAIGFSKFYLFIDDNNEKVMRIARSYSQVEVFSRDQALYEQWKSTPAFSDEKKKNLIDTEVMVRQEMNFYVASLQAKREGIDWLLHIDIDELFYPNEVDINNYFNALQKKGIASVTFLNYESISTSETSDTIYSSAIFFKINFFRRGHWLFSKEQRQYILDTNWLREKYFNYYQNGKSIINLTGKKIVFYDVHSIMADGNRLLGGHRDPIVLHFPCARYVDFCKKYNRLGDFSDVWMGYPRVGDFIEHTHLESRDIVKHNIEDGIKDYYNKNFMLNEDQIQSLLDKKMAIKIDFHLTVLRGI